MGWASGSNVMDRFIAEMADLNIPFVLKVDIYTALIDAMEYADWDTQDECMGQDTAYDEAMKVLHPD